jgi:two-component system, OmpR family, sensor kinase
VRVGLRPLTQIETTAEAIAAGELDQRVPGDTAHTEIGNLARTLNAMLTQIQGAFAARDATEAELRASEARLRRFVADASHELRTPVAAVSAYAELFQLGASARPEDLDRVMTGIRTETARMGALVEELLLLARLDEGRALDLHPVELVSLAAEAVHAARTISDTRPIRLDAIEPVEVTGDATRLRQVLDNLLANVRAHTPPGTATTVTVERHGTDAVITVADNGPGLAATDAQHVFERFYRADPSRSRDHGGSGLGLAIVAAIANAHHGTVSAAPNPTGGATFTMTLPTARADSQSDESAEQTGPRPTVSQ